MKTFLLRVFKTTVKTLAMLLAAILLYGLVSLLLSVISVNGNYTCNANEEECAEIYILTNGMHTDLVMPVKSAYKDWSALLPVEHTLAADSTYQYLAFGWGDKGFYLETPEWSQLKANVAFKAVFGLSTSAMHVSYYRTMWEADDCIRIPLSTDSYQKIAEYIEAKFQKDGQGRFIWIPNHSYAYNDAFYEANGTYNLFYTCNTWANAGLKSGGLKACVWTPVTQGVFYQYK